MAINTNQQEYVFVFLSVPVCTYMYVMSIFACTYILNIVCRYVHVVCECGA